MPRWLGLVLLALAEAPALGQPYPPITDRVYTLDLYQGAILGSSRTVGMGGASVATGQGAGSLTSNVASAAVRPATSNDRWDWDWNLDWMYPQLGSDDFNNTGQVGRSISQSLVGTGSVVVQRGPWAIGLGLGLVDHHTRVMGAVDVEDVDVQIERAHLVVARAFASDVWTVGMGLRVGTWSMGLGNGSVRTRTLFDMTGTGLEAGVVWRPKNHNYRVGLAAATSILPLTKPEPDGCNPLSCEGYILPEAVRVPWEISLGWGWRVAAGRWNRQVPRRWVDERELVVAADLVLTGPVARGAGVEAFVDKTLQPSGRDPSLSLRGGLEYEVLPGWLRLRGGSYYEPGRFSGVAGRVHGTFGIEGRVWSFCFLGDPYRVRLSATGDRAAHYGNLSLSIGFWH